MYIVEKKTGKQIIYIDGDELNILDSAYIATDNKGKEIAEEAKNGKNSKNSDANNNKRKPN